MLRRSLPLLTLLLVLVLTPAALRAATPQADAGPDVATAPDAAQATPATEALQTPGAVLFSEPIFAATECCTSKQQVDCRKQCNSVGCFPRNVCASDGSCGCLCVCPV